MVLGNAKSLSYMLVSTLHQRQLKEMDEVDIYLQFIEQNVEMHPSFASDEVGRPTASSPSCA